MLDGNSLQDKIYEVRGQKVMLDFELAEIYGYTTKAFNQQVKNNIEKFDEDFYFQLEPTEWENLMCKNCISNNRGGDDLMCKNYTSNNKDSGNLISQNVISSLGDEVLISKNLISNNEGDVVLRSKNLTSNNRGDDNLKSNFLTSSWGGRRKMPYVFTEQGIYMLMTVLKGEVAVRQSKALIRIFKLMKDYIVAEERAVSKKEFSLLSERVGENTNDIKNLIVGQSELKAVVAGFIEADKKVEKLLLDGKYVDADFVYSGIYNSAKKSIIIIDDYIGLKTLVLLKDIRKGVRCTIFSKRLHEVELEDFKRQYPEVKVEVRKGGADIHDRFIVVDYGEENEKIYLSGGSSKDAGSRKMVVSELKFSRELHEMVEGVVRS